MVLFVLAYVVRCVCCSRVVDTGLLACERPVGGDGPRSKRGFGAMMPGVSRPGILSREGGVTRH